jgi:hypothetical protein
VGKLFRGTIKGCDNPIKYCHSNGKFEAKFKVMANPYPNGKQIKFIHK